MAAETFSRWLETNRKYTLLAGLYALTGLTSVAYEVLWARMMSLQFGVSVFAVVLTVAAFMTGLGAGSLYAAKRAARIRQPLLWLALLEGGIACYALLLPFLMQAASAGIEDAAARLSLSQWYALTAGASGLLLLLPAFAMGAGFPLVLSAAGNTPSRLGPIYGLNTLGAACGALLPLWLLPALGWGGAIRIVAGIGILAAGAMYWLAARLQAQPAAEPQSPRPHGLALLAYGGIGAASLMLEVAWTRLFGMVMLRTEYVLAIILAVFLAGIALGSLIAPRQHKKGWFMALPIAAGAFSLLSLWLLPVLSAWVERAAFSTLLSAMLLQGLVLMLLTLPVTLALGAWLPLLNSRFHGGGMWLYGVNSLGGAIGAVAAGLVLIPWVGSTGTIAVSALMLAIVGLAWSESRAVWLAVPLIAAAAWPVASMPQVSRLLPQAQAGSRNLSLYEDAISMTQVVEQQDGQRLLLTDLQRMDASTEPTAVFVQANQARLPLLLHGQPHSVLFLGLGTGISVSGALPYPDLQRSAVELSQGAISAASTWFAPANHGSMSATRIVRDDARRFLSATPEKYDVIIGDVFHPDLAGVSSLLSLQQFQRARNRLNDDGLFVQWLALNQFDAGSLTVVLRTFRTAFPDAQIFLDGMHLALVGPKGNFRGAAGVEHNMQHMNEAQLAEATAGEGGWTWLGRYWGPIPASQGPVQDEWSPVIEFRLPRARYAGNLDVAATLRVLLQVRPDMQVASNLLGVPPGDRESFERAYGATELMVRSWVESMKGAAPQASRLMRLAYQANPKDQWVAYALADSMYATLGQAKSLGIDEQKALEQILHLNPQHVESLRALWRLQRGTHDAGAEATRARLLAISPLDREARAEPKIGLP
ncbi:MAG TPA: fused MFS/spermidine synthase [Gallionellaceae bacterium]